MHSSDLNKPWKINDSVPEGDGVAWMMRPSESASHFVNELLAVASEVDDDCFSRYRVIISVICPHVSLKSNADCIDSTTHGTREIDGGWCRLLLQLDCFSRLFFLFPWQWRRARFQRAGILLHGASPLYPILSGELPLVCVNVADWQRALQNVLETLSLSFDATWALSNSP